jgi:hypothetical protein
MGNRGSKSDFQYTNIQPKKLSVKEQRVDDSRFLCKIARNLRCTLMAFERKYPIKIPSKQIYNNKRFYSLTSERTYNSESIYLEPWYVTGLIDGEGSFQIRVRKNSRYKTG